MCVSRTVTTASCLVLAGDIGGTKTDLGLFAGSGLPDSLLRIQRYYNRDVAGVEELIASFLADVSETPSICCLGVAGPVFDNRVQMTNLGWRLDGAALRHRFGFETILVNDMEAMAAGILLLGPEAMHPLNPGRPVADGVLGVLALGTGLGQAYVVPQGQDDGIFPSEGGHASFAPRTSEQIALLQWMLDQQDHVSVEQVCSGTGLPALYAYFCERAVASGQMQADPAACGWQTPRIVEAGLQASPVPPARAALEMLVDILAAEAANLALKVLATRGIVIGGGLAGRLVSLMVPDCFMGIFCRGTYQRLLADIPVHVVQHQHVGLLGAAARGVRAYCGSSRR